MEFYNLLYIFLMSLGPETNWSTIFINVYFVFLALFLSVTVHFSVCIMLEYVYDEVWLPRYRGTRVTNTDVPAADEELAGSFTDESEFLIPTPVREIEIANNDPILSVVVHSNLHIDSSAHIISSTSSRSHYDSDYLDTGGTQMPTTDSLPTIQPDTKSREDLHSHNSDCTNTESIQELTLYQIPSIPISPGNKSTTHCLSKSVGQLDENDSLAWIPCPRPSIEPGNLVRTRHQSVSAGQSDNSSSQMQTRPHADLTIPSDVEMCLLSEIVDRLDHETTNKETSHSDPAFTSQDQESVQHCESVEHSNGNDGYIENDQPGRASASEDRLYMSESASVLEDFRVCRGFASADHRADERDCRSDSITFSEYLGRRHLFEITDQSPGSDSEATTDGSDSTTSSVD